MLPAQIGAELQQLPLGYLLGAPMKAAIEAQALAAKTTIDFIMQVGMQLSDPSDPASNYVLTEADFYFTQVTPDPANPGSVLEYSSKLSVPLLSIIPIPYIRISDLNVSFEFKIRDVQTGSTSFKTTGSFGFSNETDATVKASAGGGILGFLGGGSVSGEVSSKTSVQINASATYQSTNRQTTDRSATFKMTMNAVQDALPEGLSRVLNILNDVIRAKPGTP